MASSLTKREPSHVPDAAGALQCVRTAFSAYKGRFCDSLISIMVIPDTQIHAEEKSAGNSTNVLKEWQRLFTDRKSVEPLCIQINTFPVRVVFWAEGQLPPVAESLVCAISKLKMLLAFRICS